MYINQPPQDPRFTPDEEQDPRFTPDEPVVSKPVSKSDYFWNSIKKGLLEGAPEIDVLSQPEKYFPGSTRNDIYGDASRAMMGPVGMVQETYNKGIRPFTSPTNIGMLGMAIAYPPMIPHMAAIFGAQQTMQIPGQSKDLYQSARDRGIFDPETIGKAGELGLNAAMIGAGTYGGATHTIGKQTRSRAANRMDFKTDPGIENLPNYVGLPTEGTRMPPVERGLMVRPPLRPEVAEAVAGKAAENIKGSENIFNPEVFDATLTHPDGIHAAFEAGKLTKQQALRHLVKYYKDEAASKTKVTNEPIDTDIPVSLTTEAPNVQQPPGIQETIDLMTSGQIKNVTDLQKMTGLSYNRTKVIWYAAKKQIQDSQMLEGFYDHMKPDETQREPKLKEESIIKRGESNTAAVLRMREQGYEFTGLTKTGDFVFERPIQQPLNDRMEPHRETTRYTSPDNKFEVLDPEPIVKRSPTEPGESHVTFPDGRQYSIYKDTSSGIGKWEVVGLENTTASGSAFTKSEMLEHLKDLNETKPYIDKYTGRNIGKSIAEHLAEYRAKTSFRTDRIQEARTESGGVRLDVNKDQLINITGGSLYDKNAWKVIPRELMQNAIDAIGPGQGNRGSKGLIEVKFDKNNNTIEVTDNGPGMTREEIETVLTNIAESGKLENDLNAGGFGVGKSIIFQGGEHASVVTTAYNPKRGKVTQTSLQGTPDQFKTGTDPLIETDMSPNTPTGTTFRVKLTEPDFEAIRASIANVAVRSDYEGRIKLDDDMTNSSNFDTRTGQIIFGKVGSRYIDRDETKFTPLTTLKVPGADLKISVGPEEPGERGHINIVLRNNGMFTLNDVYFLKRATSNLPVSIIVDVKALVKEGTTGYPWSLSRDALREDVKTEIHNIIRDKIVAPNDADYKVRLQKLYDEMKSVNTPSGLEIYYHDTGAKYTPTELQRLIHHPATIALGARIHTITKMMLEKTGNTLWINRVERIGLIFDGNPYSAIYGIHIPNPTTGKSTILINALQIMSDCPVIDEAVAEITYTIAHEIAHVDVIDQGHNTSWSQRLGKVYGKFGATRIAQVQSELKSFASTNGNGQSYTPEFQDFLSGYKESRRRSVVTEDILTRTGSKSRITKGGPGGVSGNTRSNGKGTLGNYPDGTIISVKAGEINPANVKKLLNAGFRFIGEGANGGLRFEKSAPRGNAPILEEEVGDVRPTKKAAREAMVGQLGPIQDAMKSSIIMEAFNFPRGSMASGDLSAPLRQGLPFIHKKEFWKAMKPMFESWATEEGFMASQNSIALRPLFKKRIDADGEVLPSFADDAGLKLTDLTNLSNREERIMSTWAESGGMFNANETMAKYGGNEAAAIYAGTYGNLVRRSNRSYTAFLNNLRADVFESLIRDGDVLAGVRTNLPLAREIAGFVNTFSGRGSLGGLEKHAALLNTGLFAPRLIASRLTILNPFYYIYASPLVRREALKCLLAIAAFGNVTLQLIKMAGGEVESDPASSDFGKGRIGNTRVDPWAGIQQYVVGANRLIRPSWAKIPIRGRKIDTGIVPLNLSIGYARSGGSRVKSSTTGRSQDLWNPKGPYGQTHADVGMGFLRGKTNPVINFAWALATGAKEMNGKKMNLTTMNPMENAVMQRFIPILWQDLYNLAKEDPKMLPVIIPATFGMGMQNYDGSKD